MLYWSVGDGTPLPPRPADDEVPVFVEKERRPPRARQAAAAPHEAAHVSQGEDEPAPAAGVTEEEPAEFDAWLSARTGGMVLTGVEVDEDGAITLQPDHVDYLRKLLEVRA
jgi:hypothetical protein